MAIKVGAPFSASVIAMIEGGSFDPNTLCFF